jgi:hypothetical protein
MKTGNNSLGTSIAALSETRIPDSILVHPLTATLRTLDNLSYHHDSPPNMDSCKDNQTPEKRGKPREISLPSVKSSLDYGPFHLNCYSSEVCKARHNSFFFLNSFPPRRIRHWHTRGPELSLYLVSQHENLGLQRQSKDA